jgi:hypothetical protein
LYAVLSASLVYLLNDASTSWIGPVSLGSGGTLQTSRCLVNASASSILNQGIILTLTLAVSFNPAFAGNRTISVQLTGANGLYTAFQQVGAWTVPGSVAPSAVSLSPSSGAGRNQTFTWQFSHPGGGGMIAAAALRIVGSDGQDCTLYYHFPAGTVQMFNDSDTQWSAPVQIGSASTVQNSRCVIGVAGTSVAISGNTLSMSVPVIFQPQFAGYRTLSVQLTGTNGLYTGFQQMGTWTVP